MTVEKNARPFLILLLAPFPIILTGVVNSPEHGSSNHTTFFLSLFSDNRTF